jgi:peptidyl-prolyl cis-trans isomerase SurA
LREYYDTHLEEFDKPSGISIAEIVKFTGGLSPAQRDIVQAEMEQILARLRDGEDFFEIASTESEAGTAINGGQQDYIEDGLLGPEYEAAVAPLARNGISGVFEVADQAFVIIRLLERHTGGILSFGLARPLLEQAILREKEEPRIREYLARLRSESFVEIRAGYVDTGASEGDDGEAGEDVEGFDGTPAAEAPDDDAVD